MVEGITKTVTVLGLNVHSIHSIINWIKASNSIKGSRWGVTVQYIFSAADSHMNLFCDLAMLGIRTAKDIFW